MHNRAVIIGKEARKIIARLLVSELKDPRLTSVNITECRVSRDLRVIKIYFSAFGVFAKEQRAQDILLAFNKAKGILRSKINNCLQLKYAPELNFYYDTVPEESEKINKLLNSIQSHKH